MWNFVVRKIKMANRETAQSTMNRHNSGEVYDPFGGNSLVFGNSAEGLTSSTRTRHNLWTTEPAVGSPATPNQKPLMRKKTDASPRQKEAYKVV